MYVGVKQTSVWTNTEHLEMQQQQIFNWQKELQFWLQFYRFNFTNMLKANKIDKYILCIIFCDLLLYVSFSFTLCLLSHQKNIFSCE